MILIGTKVKYLSHYDRPTGKIGDISYMANTFTVLWDSPSLIPRMQEFPLVSFRDGTFLILDGDYSGLGRSLCECGAKFDRGFEDIHSFWCPAFKKI